MEYAGNQAANVALAGASNRGQRPMERVSMAADRVAVIADHLSGILGRFHGQPASSDRREAASPISVSYVGEIERLLAGIAVVDKLACEIAEIA